MPWLPHNLNLKKDNKNPLILLLLFYLQAQQIIPEMEPICKQLTACTLMLDSIIFKLRMILCKYLWWLIFIIICET